MRRAPSAKRRWCSPVQATGTGIQRIQDLAGADLEAQLQAATAGNIVSMQTASYTWSNFDTIFNGVRVGAGTTAARGIIGTGIGNTILTMTALSSTRSAEDPPTGTNQLYLMYFERDNLVLRCFTLQGTNQAHRYNGIRMHGVTGARISNLKLISTGPGDDFVPPGETFAINDFSGGNNWYENVEIDGTAVGGFGGATAFGANSYDGATYIDCYTHDNPESAGWALWQGKGVSTLIRCRNTNNRTSFNLERVGQEVWSGLPADEATVNIVEPTFGNIINFGQDIFLGNDRGSTTLNIYDPKWFPGRTGGTSSEIRVYFPALEQGNPNIQQQSDVHVYAGGTWTGAGPGFGTYVGGSDITGSTINYSPF